MKRIHNLSSRHPGESRDPATLRAEACTPMAGRRHLPAQFAVPVGAACTSCFWCALPILSATSLGM